jgi:hypothetical protein
MKSVALAASATITVFALAACDSCDDCDGSRPSQSVNSSVQATAPPTSAAPENHDKHALRMLNQIIQGEFSAVRTDFDDVMRQKLSVDKLSSGWDAYQQSLGTYQSHGDPEDVQRGDFTVVNVPLQMSQSAGQFRVTFHSDGTVAGLYFLRPGIPVP